MFNRDACHRPCTSVLFARVAHRDGKAIEQRHGGQVFCHLACANEQHAVLRAKSVDELRFINLQFAWRIGGSQRDNASF